MGNVGGLIATWSFLPWDAPDYRIGNGLNLATYSTIGVVSVATLAWMRRDNARRDARRSDEEVTGMTNKEAQALDWKHPAFRWRP